MIQFFENSADLVDCTKQSDRQMEDSIMDISTTLAIFFVCIGLVLTTFGACLINFRVRHCNNINRDTTLGVFALLFGLLLITITAVTLYKKHNRDGQLNTVVVQMLTAGKEVSMERVPSITTMHSIAKYKLKLPTDLVAKVGDPRRYYIRLTTNDISTTTTTNP